MLAATTRSSSPTTPISISRARRAVRRGRHGRPALHDDAPPDPAGARACDEVACTAEGRVRAGPHRRPARPGDADGPADRCRRRSTITAAPSRSATQPGGTLLCGGKCAPGPGFCVEPTIVANARNDWPCVQRETFAPILYVFEFETLDEAIALNNGVPQGLSSARSSRSTCATAEEFLSAPAATAASPTSTSARRAPRSAARSAARRKPAAAANPAPTPGRPTCAARPTRSTGAANCRSRRASSSARPQVAVPVFLRMK